MQIIVFRQESGLLATVTPTPEALASGFTLDQIARVSVPAGVPFGIVDDTDFPADRTQRMGWEISESDAAAGHGADYGTGSENQIVAWTKSLSPIIQTAAGDLVDAGGNPTNMPDEDAS